MGTTEFLAISRQCELAGVTRSTFYAPLLIAVPDEEELILALIDAEYTLHPFYGSRKMVVHLRIKGYSINRKRVQRLMRVLGLAGMAPGPNTSRPHPQHKIYPYLLRGVDVTRPNQVWSTDITYVRLARGFVYLAAVIDWYSRKVLAWRLSEVLDLRYDDINFETNLISIWINKGDRPRSIPMTERVGAILKNRKCNGASKPFTVDKHQAGTAWDWTRKKMGYMDDPEFVLHALRHTTATRLIDKGIDLYTVKEWLGHSTIQVTERYAHLNPAKLVHAAMMLE